MISSTTGLKNNHPLFAKRPASSEPVSVPQDEVILSARPEPSVMSFGAKAMAFGALGLSTLGCLSGTVQAQEAPEARPVHRHSNPLSGEQTTRLQELGEWRDTDTGEARDVRTNYRNQVNRLVRDANHYMDLSEKLESEGRRLEEAGLTTETQDGITTSVSRQGDNWTVTIDNGRTRQILEDTPAMRQVTDGINSTTLHLQDGVLHRAGDFESQQFTRSWQDSLTVNGTRITRNLERMVPDEVGRARLNQTEVFEEPQSLQFDGGGPQLVYKQSSTKRNIHTHEVTTSSKEVEVNEDGTTRSR